MPVSPTRLPTHPMAAATLGYPAFVTLPSAMGTDRGISCVVSGVNPVVIHRPRA